MAEDQPRGDVDERFSIPGASPTEWNDATGQLAAAEVYWLSTVRAGGRPHVTPLVGLWLDDCFVFCTGADEQKAKNLAQNANCVVTTGTSAFAGIDFVVEGEALRVTDSERLGRVAGAYNGKYGPPFQFQAVAGGLQGDEGNEAIVFEVRPAKVFASAKWDTFSQTRRGF